MVFMKSIEVNNMIQIGSTGRNSGKTTIAKKIITTNHHRFSIYGLKIITISGARGKCQRGETGCGICTSISENYELTEETNCEGSKDTMQLLKAGCKKVYLLKSFNECLLEGFLTFLQFVPKNSLIICESNSIRNVIKPSLFLMMNNQKSMKETAAKVIAQADIILETPELPEAFNLKNTKNGIQFSEDSTKKRREIV